jgi:subfamily B ATP-binding cassette protein MsbA
MLKRSPTRYSKVATSSKESKSDKPFSGFSFDAQSYDDIDAWPVFKRIVRECIKPHRRLFLMSAATMGISAATSGVIPILLQRMGDDVFVGKNPTLLIVLPIAMITIMTIRSLCGWVGSVVDASLSTKIVAELRFRMFDTIAAADLAWIQGFPSGRFVSACISDVGAVNAAGTGIITGAFRNGLTFVFVFSAMFYLDWRMSLVVMIGAPVAILNLNRQKKRIKRAAGLSYQESGNLSSRLTQTLLSMRVVKAYGQETAEAMHLRKVVRNLRKYAMRATRAGASIGPVWDIGIGIGVTAALFYGGWQGIYGTVTLGHFMGFIAAALMIVSPLKGLSGIQTTLITGLIAAARVFAVIDYPSHVTEKPGAKPLPIAGGGISFRNVDFGYDPNRLVLSDFNLDIPAGKRVALVGPSGAGKSTVLNLILRFFDPERGSVSIDGYDVRDVTIVSVRGAMALLTQDPVLFDDTIAANIRYGSEGTSDEAMIAAAEAAAAHDFIVQLPNGYLSHVGEAGNRLSGGERQRIAFARAMLRNSPIILLDEPTSSLDAASEAKVQEAMNRLLAGRTVVMIAHRLATVQRADKICYMENGRVLEEGTHTELIALGGKYAHLVEKQFLFDERQTNPAAIRALQLVP